MRNLQTLPTEIIQHIAIHLPDVNDLLYLSLTSHKFYSAIQTQAVFREHFLRIYDRPQKWDNYNYKHHYTWRTTALNSFLDNKNAIYTESGPEMQLTYIETSPKALKILEEARDLILEASAKNFAHLRRFALRAREILSNDKYDSSSLPQTLITLQLVLTNIAAIERIEWFATPSGPALSQKLAYGNAGGKIFVEDDLDIDTLTRIWGTANFFLMHFNGLIQGLESRGLKYTFDQLSGEERGAPGLWENNQWLSGEFEMPKYWFGFYVYLEPEGLSHLRSNRQPILQEDHYDGIFTIMELTTTPTTFTGTGTDTDTFTVNGTITALPSAFSIPNFRRISFSMDYPNDRWLYDSCLLPNSQTMVGRWITYEENGLAPFEGPFIMWAVSREDYEREKALREDEGKEGEADDFLNL